MYSVTVLLEGRENALILWYRERGKAVTAAQKIMDAGEAEDSFGHLLHAKCGVSAVLITDMEGDFEAQTEIQLRQARANAKANTKAQNDPLLKFQAAQRPTGSFG